MMEQVRVIYEEERKQFLKYFTHIGKDERTLVAKWYFNQRRKSANQKRSFERHIQQNHFLDEVRVALNKITYDYEIMTIEPSISDQGKLFFEEGNPICTGLTCYEWEKKAKEFALEYNSDIATLYELLFWYAYRIAMGYWTLSYVCEDSSSQGNYGNSPDASYMLETSGKREIGGASDGVGNSYKIVKDDVGFLWCGGGYKNYGHIFPVASHGYYEARDDSGCAVIVIRR